MSRHGGSIPSSMKACHNVKGLSFSPMGARKQQRVRQDHADGGLAVQLSSYIYLFVMLGTVIIHNIPHSAEVPVAPFRSPMAKISTAMCVISCTRSCRSATVLGLWDGRITRCRCCCEPLLRTECLSCHPARWICLR
jgi:hypothetical protein